MKARSNFFAKNFYFILCALVIFFIGTLFGRVTKEDVIIRSKVLREDGYKYIKPVLLCNTDNQQAYNEDLALSKELNDYVKKSKNNVSVYFLNIGNGQWASINEKMTFSPASMLKIPTVVDVLKYAELNPEVMNKEVYYGGTFNDNNAEYFKSEKYIEPQKYYSTDELLKYTVEYSDNNAVRLLHDNISSHSLEQIYRDLKIDIPENTIDFMTAKTYSLFLRVLYNSTYLNREMSEKMIKMMINTDFPIGIRSGVPKDFEVAHKFGERQVFSTNGSILKRELHDCGIIYGEKQSYILCVMTSGTDFNSLAGNISDISTLVYKHTNQ